MKRPRTRTGRSPVRPADDTPSAAPSVAPAAPPETAVPLADAPSADAIRAHAYERYVARGRTPGAELDDWLAAERALQARGAAGDGRGPSEATPAP